MVEKVAIQWVAISDLYKPAPVSVTTVYPTMNDIINIVMKNQKLCYQKYFLGTCDDLHRIHARHYF